MFELPENEPDALKLLTEEEEGIEYFFFMYVFKHFLYIPRI